jgi:hypothetical protein
MTPPEPSEVQGPRMLRAVARLYRRLEWIPFAIELAAVSVKAALDLQVEPDKAPMRVNSDAQVANLDSDKLDGQDSSAFVRSTYSKTNSTAGGGASEAGASVACDAGDFALSGGYFNLDPGTHLDMNSPSLADNTPGWQLHWQNDATLDTVTVVVLCADVGTPHQ